jgi:hypothetical protein
MASVQYISEFSSKVAGIPCTIGVVEFSWSRGSYSYNAASDMDYYGYVEFAYDVLDRRGRKAEWLERKLTDADVERLQEEAIEHFRND